MKLESILKLFVPILLFIMGVITIDEMKATHIVGGEMTYQHIRDDVYLVRVTLRRDCFLGSPEAEFDNPASVTIFTVDGAQASWLQALQPYGTNAANAGPNGEYIVGAQLFLPLQQSDTLNQFIRSDCGFEGTQVCVHETTYQGLLRLPFRSSGYILAYQRCCRNETVFNIQSPLETGATYWTHITGNALTNQNSSPRFNQWPDVYICADTPLEFNHSARDIDGDSLVYKLVLPNSGATRFNPRPQPIVDFPFPFVEWRSPYSIDNLLGGVPLQINSQTGEITATPNLVGQFLVGVLVEEYRNGRLIGSTRRDFQYNVRICSQPPLAQFTTSETNCDGLTVEFYNESLAANDFTWSFDYPNGDPNFTSKEENPVFTFPTSGIYNVKLLAVRGSDACSDSIIQEVFVFENKIVPDFSFQLIDCNPTIDSLSIILTDLSVYDEPGFVITERTWIIEQNGNILTFTGDGPTVPLSYLGEIKVSITVEADNGCKSTIEKIINAEDLLPRSDFHFELVGCPEDGIAEIRLIDKSAPLNPFAVISSTIFTVNGVDYLGSPVLVRLPQATQSFDVTLHTIFETTCEISLTKTLDLSALVPRSDYAWTPVDCPDDSTVALNLVYIDTLSNGLNATGLEWSVGILGNLNSSNDNPITITIPKDSILFVNLITTFENECIDRINDQILPGPFASLSFVPGPIILCPGDESSLVIGGNPNWIYTWTPTEGLDLTEPHNPKVSSDSNRVYNVVVDDGLCQVEGSVEVIALQGGIVLSITSDTVSCDGNITLTASGGVGEGTYLWGDEPNVNTVLATGEVVNLTFRGRQSTFFVRFVGESCSTEPASVTVTNEAPSIDALSPLRLCPGDSREVITFNLIDHHVNNFTWQDHPIILSGANSPNPRIGIDSFPLGEVVLYFSTINQFGCTLSDSITVIIDSNPVIDFTFDIKDCGLYEVCFEIEGDYTGFTIWDFGDPDSDDDRSLEEKPCYKYTNPGIFIPQLINNTTICPFLPVTKEIVINPQISIDAIDDRTICLGDSVNINIVANIEDVNYIWTDINNNIVNSGKTLSYSGVNDTTFFVVGTDVNGCKDSISVDISVFKFAYDVNLRDTLCLNNPVEILLNIDNSSEYEITWYPQDCIVSGDSTTNPIILPQADKEIQLILVHVSTGCRDSSSYNPDVYDPFSFEVELPFGFCIEQDQQIELLINNPENYSIQWTPEDIIVSGGEGTSPLIRLLDDGTISVLVTEIATGCFESQVYNIEALDIPIIEVDAEPDFTIYEGREVEIFIADIISGATYQWSTGESGTTITVSPRETTSYTVTVTDELGCIGTDEVTVIVRNAQCDETDVYLPNAFTPNGDGVNDVFIVRSNFIEEMDFVIYNRWGQEIFKTSDIDQGWDGTFNGVALPPDSYAYYIRALCVNAEEYRKTGNVTLIR